MARPIGALDLDDNQRADAERSVAEVESEPPVSPHGGVTKRGLDQLAAILMSTGASAACGVALARR